MRAHLSTVKKYNITWIDCLVGAWQRYANLMALPAVFDCWNRDIADLLPTRNLEIKFGDKPVVLGRCTCLLRHRGENAGNICGVFRLLFVVCFLLGLLGFFLFWFWWCGCLCFCFLLF